MVASDKAQSNQGENCVCRVPCESLYRESEGTQFSLWVLQGCSSSSAALSLQSGPWPEDLGVLRLQNGERLRTKPPFISCPSHLPVSLNLIALLGSCLERAGGGRGLRCSLNPAPVFGYEGIKQEEREKKKKKGRDEARFFPSCNLLCKFHPVTLTRL